MSSSQRPKSVKRPAREKHAAAKAAAQATAEKRLAGSDGIMTQYGLNMAVWMHAAQKKSHAILSRQLNPRRNSLCELRGSKPSESFTDRAGLLWRGRLIYQATDWERLVRIDG
jgi:hypothetical protein